jgi:hypothetical protein
MLGNKSKIINNYNRLFSNNIKKQKIYNNYLKFKNNIKKKNYNLKENEVKMYNNAGFGEGFIISGIEYNNWFDKHIGFKKFCLKFIGEDVDGCHLSNREINSDNISLGFTSEISVNNNRLSFTVVPDSARVQIGIKAVFYTDSVELISIRNLRDLYIFNSVE